MTSKTGKKVGQARNKAYDLARAGLRTAYLTIPAGLYALSVKAPEFLKQVYSHVPFLNGKESQALQVTQHYSPMATGISAGLLTSYLLDRRLEKTLPNSPTKRALAKNLGYFTFANLGNFLINQSSAVANASSSVAHGLEELTMGPAGEATQQNQSIFYEAGRAIKDNFTDMLRHTSDIATNVQTTDFSNPENIGYCAMATLLAIPAVKTVSGILKSVYQHLLSTPTRTYEERRIIKDLEKDKEAIKKRVE